MPQYSGLGLPLLHAGKVRELYALDDPATMLMVASDRVSAYDHILQTPIPDKGIVLTQLSVWWFDLLAGLVENHVVSTDVPAPVLGRALVVERLAMVPSEAVVRGYLTGSGWAEYQTSGSVCGVQLPDGLHDGSRLPEPIFTPAFKAPMGEHDENITFERMVEIVGLDLAERVRDTSTGGLRPGGGDRP